MPLSILEVGLSIGCSLGDPVTPSSFCESTAQLGIGSELHLHVQEPVLLVTPPVPTRRGYRTAYSTRAQWQCLSTVENEQRL